MSVYILSSRVSSVENSVDELGRKADSTNAVFTGTTTLNGPVVFNGAVAFGSSIAGIDISDVSGLQASLDTKAPLASPTFTGTVNCITNSMVGLGSVDNTADADKPVSSATQDALNLKAPVASPTFTGTVSGITKSMVGLGNVDNTADLEKPISKYAELAYNILLEMIGAKANKVSPTFSGSVASTTHQTRTDQYQVRLRLLSMQRLR